jgi:GNAT superfamily N-acetyltransferase
MSMQVLSARDHQTLYRSRAFWEAQFQQLGLWHPMFAMEQSSVLYSNEIDARFPDLQMVCCIEECKVAGIAHCVPIHIGALPTHELPDTGWSWALQIAVEQNKKGVMPDTICGLSITVLPDVQNAGVGSALIRAILSAARSRKMHRAVMPVRPILKSRWPSISMDEYLSWRRRDGYHVDPWIRAHEKVGGRVSHVCSRSMAIVAPLDKWRSWSGEKLDMTGSYALCGSLIPVRIDPTSGAGVYVEPNVWIIHELL